MYSIGRTCILILAIGCTAFSADKPEREQQLANIHIRFVNSYGTELGNEPQVDAPQVDSFEITSGGANLASRFRNGMATHIPFGVYRLRAHASGFWNTEREVRIFQQTTLVLVSLDVGTEGGWQTSKVTGRIANAKSPTNSMHLRLSGVYSTIIIDAELQPDGSFEFLKVPHGLYVLMTVTRGSLESSHVEGSVLNSQIVSVPVSSPLTVELNNK